MEARSLGANMTWTKQDAQLAKEIEGTAGPIFLVYSRKLLPKAIAEIERLQERVAELESNILMALREADRQDRLGTATMRALWSDVVAALNTKPGAEE